MPVFAHLIAAWIDHQQTNNSSNNSGALVNQTDETM